MNNVVKLALPETWAPFLINKDASNLPEEEIATIFAVTEGYRVIDVEQDDPFFMWRHDAYNLMRQGANCMSFVCVDEIAEEEMRLLCGLDVLEFKVDPTESQEY